MDVFHPYADKLGQILRLSYISPPWDSPMQEDIFPLLKQLAIGVRPNSIIGYSFSASNSCANSAIPLVNRLHPTLSEYIRFFSGMAHLHRHLCLLCRCPTLRRNLASFTLPALPAPVLWNRTYAVSPLSVSGEGRCYRAVVTYSGETACWVYLTINAHFLTIYYHFTGKLRDKSEVKFFQLNFTGKWYR